MLGKSCALKSCFLSVVLYITFFVHSFYLWNSALKWFIQLELYFYRDDSVLHNRSGRSLEATSKVVHCLSPSRHSEIIIPVIYVSHRIFAQDNLSHWLLLCNCQNTWSFGVCACLYGFHFGLLTHLIIDLTFHIWVKVFYFYFLHSGQNCEWYDLILIVVNYLFFCF